MLNLCYYYFHSYKYTLYVVQWLKPILDIFLSHDIPKAKLFHVFCFLQSTIFRLVLMTKVFQALQKSKDISPDEDLLVQTCWLLTK